MIDAIERFSDDLRAAGAGREETVATVALYEHALSARSADAWSRFYRATFWLVQAVAGAPVARTPRSEAALASLRLMLADDLGSALFGESLQRIFTSSP